MEADIPVVDFQQLSKQDELDKLKEACEKCGCFRVINHPIPTTLMLDMKMVSKYLHELPTETKKCNESVVPESGYRSSLQASPLYESYGIYDMYHSPQALDDFCTQLNVPLNYRKIIKAYGPAIHELASNISQKMAECLGIVGAHFEDWPFVFRIIKYNFTQETIGSTGAELHSDLGFVTLLQDDETVGGLEMMDDSGTFLAVPPKSASFICITGDVGHVWSNGSFRNVKHRVLCKETTYRYCIGIFMLASRDGNVEVPMELIDIDHPCLYRSFKLKDLREFRINTGKRAGEGLDQFRIVE